MRISPQPLPPLSCFLLQPLKHRIARRILPIPPAPAVYDERVIGVCAVLEEHNGDGAPVLVLTMRLKRDFFSKAEATCLAL